MKDSQRAFEEDVTTTTPLGFSLLDAIPRLNDCMKSFYSKLSFNLLNILS